MLAGIEFFKMFAKYLVGTRNVRLRSDQISLPRNDVRITRYYYRTLAYSRLYYLLFCRLVLRRDRTGAFATKTSELFIALIRKFTIVQAKLELHTSYSKQKVRCIGCVLKSYRRPALVPCVQYVCMVTHIERVWINRVWLPIRLVVS